MEGVVLLSTGHRYRVLSDDDLEYECVIRGRFRMNGIKSTNPIAVGDRVSFITDPSGSDSSITQIHDRRNCIVRRSVNLSKQTHIIASNVDTVYVVAGLARPYTPQGFIDRFLLAAESFHIPAQVLFNKCDLWDDSIWDLFNTLAPIYAQAGYLCKAISAAKGIGIEDLKNDLAGKAVLFSGNSGVGKSALVNAIEPGLTLRTGLISETHLKGKHTTTFAEMHRIANKAFIIDTPGIREFGMVNVRREEITHYFPDFRQFASQCRFSNCTHEHEPGCAIKEAVEQKEISILRYKGYLNILNGEELKDSEWKTK